MSKLDQYRNKGYYMHIVSVGVNEYAVAISRPFNENKKFIDLRHPADYLWRIGDTYFRDCRTSSRKEATDALNKMRKGFKLRQEDPAELHLNRPDAVIVEDPSSGYALKVSDGIWWLPRSKPSYLDLYSLDFGGTVKEAAEDFHQRAFTKNKKFILALHEACLRTGKAPKGGFKEVSAEDLRGDDDI